MSDRACLLCKVDAFECDEGTRRSLYFLIGKEAPPSLPLCEAHVSNQAFALVTLAMVTGHSDFAEPIQKALEAPKLTLVRSDTSGTDRKVET